MTIERIEVWHCDAFCTASAPAGSDGWFDAVHVHGCPAHAEIVEAHKCNLTYDTRGRGSRAQTTVSLACACRWTPPSRWSHGSTALLVTEYLAHVRDVTRSAPSTPYYPDRERGEG